MVAHQRSLFRRLGRRCDGLEDLLPDSPLGPAGKTIVDRLVWAIFPRAIHPTTADLALGAAGRFRCGADDAFIAGARPKLIMGCLVA